MEALKISWKLKKKAHETLSKETGTIFKDPGGKIKKALVYPNTYHLGMSNLALHALYRLINDHNNCVAERAFLPDAMDIAEYERTNTALFTLESQRPLSEFDIIAFSISFEEDYINLVRILKLAKIPHYRTDRPALSVPIVIAGGAAPSLNPEPVADLIDLFVLGDGEAAMSEFIEKFEAVGEGGDRVEPPAFATIGGVYVPELYGVTYDGSMVESITAQPGAPSRVLAARNMDIDSTPMPETAIITTDTAFSSTTLMEIQKGCPRFCRFCAAGFLYLPPRWRSAEKVTEAIVAATRDNGKVGLVGAAVSEYPGIKDLLKSGIKAGGELTLSSIRADMLDAELLTLMKESGYKTVTIAPEAGSERMRNVINKCMSEAEILESVALIHAAGFQKLKLYFLAGLPSETDADALAIVELTAAIRGVFKKGKIFISINPFIPKPVTPFQWHPYERVAILEKRFKAIKSALRSIKGVDVNTYSPKEAFYQTAISRGDRRLSAVIVKAALENISIKRAFKGFELSVEEMVYRERCKEEIFPWDIIDHGIKKDYLWSEYARGLAGKTTVPCVVGSCTRCGVC